MNISKQSETINVSNVDAESDFFSIECRIENGEIIEMEVKCKNRGRSIALQHLVLQDIAELYELHNLVGDAIREIEEEMEGGSVDKKKAPPIWENYQVAVEKHFEKAKKSINDTREALDKAMKKAEEKNK